MKNKYIHKLFFPEEEYFDEVQINHKILRSVSTCREMNNVRELNACVLEYKNENHAVSM